MCTFVNGCKAAVTAEPSWELAASPGTVRCTADIFSMCRFQCQLACSDGVQEGDEVVAHGRRQLLRQPKI